MVPTVRKVIFEAASTPLRVIHSYVSRLKAPIGKPPLFLFGFNDWKTFMSDWFPDNEVIFVPMKAWPIDFEIDWKWKILSDKRSSVMAWQYKGLPGLKEFCKKHGLEFHYVEDGFIRSIALGAQRVPPLSLAFDTQDMYFNAQERTDLEDILATYDFDSDSTLIERARSAIRLLLKTKLSKYNMGGAIDIGNVYGPKTRKRILVVGQVERDASIEYGCSTKITNNDLVWLARRENPDAHIIYKPHPEVLHGKAKFLSDPAEVSGAAQLLVEDIALSDAFETIDHVYTITSLAGFEALLRGIKVTTFGCPFYSGWGLTDDRQENPRRGRKLSVEAVFAGSYIIYTKYIDPITKKRSTIEEAMLNLDTMKRHPPIAEVDQTVSAVATEAVSTVGSETAFAVGPHETIQTIRAIRRVLEVLDPVDGAEPIGKESAGEARISQKASGRNPPGKKTGKKRSAIRKDQSPRPTGETKSTRLGLQSVGAKSVPG